MKVVLTGGGTGGHFYPLIAIAQQLYEHAEKRNLVEMKLYYCAPEPYDENLLLDNGIEYRRVMAGKIRAGDPLKNILDVPKTFFGILGAIGTIFSIFPDVVIGKGAYGSLPILVVARLFGIPVVIHESDAVPGRVNRWAGRFAKRIAISYGESAKYFKHKDRIALTGRPILRELFRPIREGAREELGLREEIPTVFIVGGSQGAELINDTITLGLPKLVEKYQIVHQTGEANYKKVVDETKLMLEGNIYTHRYKVFPSLNALALRMIAGIADVVVSRGGSMLFEFAAWRIPVIIVPITHSQGNHQRENAYNYARSGAGEVVEEKNLSPNLLISEIGRITGKPGVSERMKEAAKRFAKIDAADLIADEVISIGLKHEK